MKKLSILLAVALLAGIAAPAAGAVSQLAPDGAYIVKLKDTASDSPTLFSAADTEVIYEDAGLYRVESLEDVEKLGSSVEYYEPDATATLLGLTNDKYSSYQWNLEMLSVEAAWNRGYTGAGVRVGVIDSGVNLGHEDLQGSVIEKGLNMFNGSSNVTDTTGHGTFITGTIAAVTNNYLGIAGLCEEVTIIPIKCFESKETGSSYVIASIYEAVDYYDCDILNLSLGVTENLSSLRAAINYAVDKGVIVVSAVGNEGTKDLYFPAAYPNVIGVGAVDSAGKVSSFSQRNESVFVTAPGSGLVGLGIGGASSYVPKANGNGTSYAVPHVVAAAVFMKEHDPKADVEDFKLLLMESVRDAGASGYDTSYGYGLLDIQGLINVMDGEEESSIGDIFPDVKGHWAEDSIAFCVENGYFNGVSANSFAPEALMSRAMFVTVLSRVSGDDISGYQNPFLDVPNNEYYTQACAWGVAMGIVQGIGAAEFGPNGQVTREQMAVFLQRFAVVYGLSDGSASPFALSAFYDNASVSSYAREAMAWAVENGLISGRTSTTLVPAGNAKRCEVATIITRFVTEFMS